MRAQLTHRVAVSLAWLLGLGLFLGSVGCGGLDSDDMRARMIKRPPEPEEDESPAPRLAAAKPAEDVAPPQAPTAQPPEPVKEIAKVANPPAETGDQQASGPVAAAPLPTEPMPKTPEGRARRSAENLEKIAAALEQYRAEKGRYPLFAIADATRTPLLSWRVELLPYLGYNDLYVKFDQKQPWYAPKNKALLAEIPPVYMSPERADGKTNYLAPMGSATIFQKMRTLHPQRVEDGLNNTVLLVEVDDQLAQEWTKPEEYPFNPKTPKLGLGGLRGGQVFLAWGGGMVGAVSLKSSDQEMKAIFTADGGEPYTMASLNRPIDFSTTSAGPVIPPAAAPAGGSGAVTTASGLQPIRGGAGGSALADKYLQAATAALNENEPTDAWQFAYASTALGGPGVEMNWFPALRRPAVALHFAVGVTSDSARPTGNRRRNRATSQVEIEKATAPFGAALLAILEKHAAKVSIAPHLPAAGKDSRRRSTRSFDPAAAITVLDGGSEAQLRSEAMHLGCDVLALFEVDDNPRSKHRVVRLKLYDLASRKETWTSRRLVYNQLEQGRNATADDEDLTDAKWRLEDMLEDGLSPKPWPVTLSANIAKRRVASLAKSRDPYPPRVIAEMLHYRHRGLVDSADLLSAMQSLLGKEAGVDLLLGSDSKRRRVIREWLPASNAEELLARAERRRDTRRSDD